MRIAMIGAGMIGATSARLLAALGHDITITNRRGPDAVRDLLAELGPRGRWAPLEEAARWGELIFLAVPWRTPEALPPADTVIGKIVIDAMNPYTEQVGIIDLGTSTSSEETARRLPGARIVKAFNTIYFQHLATQGRTDLPEADRRAIFIAGDDAEAKAFVAGLVRDLGFAAVDTGGLREGGCRQQPGTDVYNAPLTGIQARTLLGLA